MRLSVSSLFVYPCISLSLSLSLLPNLPLFDSHSLSLTVYFLFSLSDSLFDSLSLTLSHYLLFSLSDSQFDSLSVSHSLSLSLSLSLSQFPHSFSFSHSVGWCIYFTGKKNDNFYVQSTRQFFCLSACLFLSLSLSLSLPIYIYI